MSKGSISKKEIPTPEKGIRKEEEVINFHYLNMTLTAQYLYEWQSLQ